MTVAAKRHRARNDTTGRPRARGDHDVTGPEPGRWPTSGVSSPGSGLRVNNGSVGRADGLECLANGRRYSAAAEQADSAVGGRDGKREPGITLHVGQVVQHGC